MRHLAFVPTLVLATLGLMLAGCGSADAPSAVTRPEALAAHALPAGLPAIFASPNADADAAALYDQAFAFYQSHRYELRSDPLPAALADEFTRLMVKAMQAGKVRQGFLDDTLSIEPGIWPKKDSALVAGPTPILMRAAQLHEQGKTKEAMLAAQSVWALGQRAFQNNQTLAIRRLGLELMQESGNAIAGIDRTIDLLAWSKAIKGVNKAWDDKTQVVWSVTPHIGDLLNIARNDQDPTFRVAATLWLAVAKFSPRTPGNLRAINAQIARAKTDADPTVAKAGAAAEAFTVEQLRKINLP